MIDPTTKGSSKSPVPEASAPLQDDEVRPVTSTVSSKRPACADPQHENRDADAPTGAYSNRKPKYQGAEPLNIVVLGASFGGLSCAHHFLDYTIGRLRITHGAPTYRLIIVSPSTHIYWNIGAPRAIVNASLLKHEDLFIPIEPGFQRHRGLAYTIIQGTAIGLDTESRSVSIECLNNEAQKRCCLILSREDVDRTASASQFPRIQTLPYHAIIACTGTSAHSDLLSLHGPHLGTVDVLNNFHTSVAQARSIVVCGAGCSGVEVAGQLATYLNYEGRNPMRRKVNNRKLITLISGSERCLPGLPPKYGHKAEKQLRSLGVEIKLGVRVLEAVPWFDQTGATMIELDNNTRLIADVYIACTGVRPNSAYMPPSLLNEQGYILTNASTMRVDPAGPRVYSIGDVASYSHNYIPDVYAAVPVVMHNMLNDLLKYELELASPYGGNDDKIAQLVDEEYQQRPKDSQLCPVTKYGGVGMLMGLGLPKIMVYALKGHDYRVCKAKSVVVDGGNPYAVPVTPGKYE